MQSENKFFTTDRGEREIYLKASGDETIYLPLTFDGFEALLEACCSIHDLPADDSMRSVLAGYVHHIKNEECQSTKNTLANVLRKSASNACTYLIDQAVKKKAQDEKQAAAILENEKRQKAFAEEKLKAAAEKRHLKSVKKTGKNEART